MAQPFDAAHRRLTGQPVTIADSIFVSHRRIGSFSTSATGHLAYQPLSRESELGWLHRSGQFERLGVERQVIGQLRLSPDGRSALAVISADDGTTKRIGPRPTGPVTAATWLYQQTEYNSSGGTDRWGIAMRDLESRTSRFILPGAALGTFSPDGHWIAYIDEGTGQTWVQAVAGSPRWQVSPGGWLQLPNWTTDGRQIAFLEGNRRIVAVDFSPDTGVSVGAEDVLFERPGIRLAALAADFSRAVACPESGRHPDSDYRRPQLEPGAAGPQRPRPYAMTSRRGARRRPHASTFSKAAARAEHPLSEP